LRGRRRRDGVPQWELRVRAGGLPELRIAGVDCARAVSPVEREAHTAGVDGAGGLYAGEADAVAVVLGGRDIHVRAVSAVGGGAAAVLGVPDAHRAAGQ